MRRPLAILLAAALLGGCSDDPTSPLPRAGAPRKLEFAIGGYGAPSRTITAEGDSVVFTWHDWGAMETDTIVAHPTDAQWRDFWAAARDAGVERWRRSYVAEGVVDGTGWGLVLLYDDREIVSQGSNAWPDRFGREHELEMTPEFRAVVDAMGMLAGREL